ncbi:hypothetical protein K4A83_06330 [Spirulina subsalsa FACHB-351]|uniref:Uncharacterized protein n=1 Tax=Spirulina subsalsa FACHB-351 TaxID=234711 RepID=A0ABT3L328_9CYAN|nr:hypothetical protein [Spirulina subsalsa]MCW6035888.1 hypothetical protein [Spirulina subsalsa FACHB-351]
MDGLQQQLLTLNYKVDALYQMMEQLTHQFNQCVASCSVSSSQERLSGEFDALSPPLLWNDLPVYPPHAQESENLEMMHKDILKDEEGWDIPPDYNLSDQDLAPELQIRRLTAQVTAAYHRIAALEEQLLAQRVH